MDKVIEVLLAGSPVAKIRTVFGLSFLVLMGVSYLTNRKRRKKITKEEEEKEIEEHFEKDENGLYPWEANSDDSPDSIPKNASAYDNEWIPKRGRWN